jgi:hypothetical protein
LLLLFVWLNILQHTTNRVRFLAGEQLAAVETEDAGQQTAAERVLSRRAQIEAGRLLLLLLLLLLLALSSLSLPLALSPSLSLSLALSPMCVNRCRVCSQRRPPQHQRNAAVPNQSAINRWCVCVCVCVCVLCVCVCVLCIYVDYSMSDTICCDQMVESQLRRLYRVTNVLIHTLRLLKSIFRCYRLDLSKSSTLTNEQACQIASALESNDVNTHLIVIVVVVVVIDNVCCCCCCCYG